MPQLQAENGALPVGVIRHDRAGFSLDLPEFLKLRFGSAQKQI